jgi:hypothetical protein
MSNSALDTKPEVTAERQEFYDRLSKKSAAPLWEVPWGFRRCGGTTSCVPF